MLITSYVLVPYARTYGDVVVSEVVDPAARPVVGALAARCGAEPATVVGLLAAAAVTAVEERPPYAIDLDSGPVRDRLAQNIAPTALGAPLFLGQGTDDEVVPIRIQREYATRVCADPAAAVTIHEYPGGDHMSVVAPGSEMIDDLLAWTDTVIAGEPGRTC